MNIVLIYIYYVDNGIVYIYIMEYYSAIKNIENFAICNKVDGPEEYYV